MGYVNKHNQVYKAANILIEKCHSAALQGGWWSNVNLEDPLFTPSKLCLIHSEISEAMEADRKSLNDDHLPDRLGLEVELGDAVIRIFDLAGGLGLDLGGAIVEKLEYNAKRADHQPENRAKENGKSY